MRFGPVPINEAVGAILAHSLVDASGHKMLSKGRVLTEEDVWRLQERGWTDVVVVRLDPGDLDENAAAQRIGVAVAGAGLDLVAPGVGRANLLSSVFGVLRVNVPALERLNNIDPGIAVATLRQHTLVRPGDQVGLVKIIPFAMSESRVVDAERMAGEAAPILAVRPLISRSVAMIVSGPPSAQSRLAQAFDPPIRRRVQALTSRLNTVVTVEHNVPSVAEAIRQQVTQRHDVILLASISAIIDAHDIAPTALLLAGGSVTHFGVPVDPGNLLMLGYVGDIPVVGMPGCVKSLKTNVIDLLLPRLFAGERLTRADLVALGHGGLMEDVAADERGVPREEKY